MGLNGFSQYFCKIFLSFLEFFLICFFVCFVRFALKLPYIPYLCAAELWVLELLPHMCVHCVQACCFIVIYKYCTLSLCMQGAQTAGNSENLCHLLMFNMRMLLGCFVVEMRVKWGGFFFCIGGKMEGCFSLIRYWNSYVKY